MKVTSNTRALSKSGVRSITAASVALGLLAAGQTALAQHEGDKALSVQQLRDLAGTNHWAVYPDNPVLRPGVKDEWDAGAVGSMTVLKVGEVFHMYYEAWGAPHGGNRGLDYRTLQIGHATSRDGVHWTKDPANPVLPKGDGKDWDKDGSWDPFVLYENGVFKMWYGGGMDRHCEWGYAVSTDGVKFVKKGQISHLGDVEDDHVAHDNASGRYFMYYCDRKIEGGGLVCAQSPNETDFDFAHAAQIHIDGMKYPDSYKFSHVFQDAGQWHMFFAADVSWRTGYATSPDGLHWTARNPNLFLGQDGEVIKVADDLWLMYFGPPGLFDKVDCDVRLALYKGKLADMTPKK